MIKKIILKIWPILFIFAVWFIFASPYFARGLVPFPSRYLVTFFPPWSAAYGMPVKNNAMPDVITQIYPWKKLTIDTWKSGAVPLWNPYSFSGTAHAANYQTAVFSPLNLLFFVLPFLDAWSLLVLFQPLLAGLFMYLFLRELKLSQAGGLVGSLAFMFCGFIVVWMAYGTLGYAVLWLPLILWVIHREMRQNSWWNLTAITTGLALSFFSGHFQISTYVAGLALIYILFETMRIRNFFQGFRLIVFYLLGLILSSPQLLPSFVAYFQSNRSSIFTGGGEIIPFQYLMTIFAPDFYGNPVTRNDWFGHYAEWASFIGVVPLILAIYSLFRKKESERWFFFTATVVALALALPTPFSDWLFQAKLPAISTSAGSRIIVLVSFSLAVLSSFGLDSLVSDWKSHKGKTLIALILLLTIFLGTTWLALLSGKVLPFDKLVVAKRNMILPTVVAIISSALFLMGLAVRTKPLQKLIVLFLIGITAFEMLRYATKWLAFDPRGFVYPKMDVAEFLQHTVGNDRVFGNIYNEFTGYFYLPTISGYDALYQDRYGEFISTATDGRLGIPERSVVNIDKHGRYTEKILELLGVKYLVHRLSDGRFGWAYPYWTYPFYNSIYKDKYYEVFENTHALPRVFLASTYKVIVDNQKIIDEMFSPTFNLKEMLVLEKKPTLEPQVGSARFSIAKYQPNKVTINVEASVPKLLFISDVYDSGWQVKVDGKLTPLYRADYDFRAVAVQAGKHDIVFIYRPLSFKVGLAAALGVVLVLVLGSLKALFL